MLAREEEIAKRAIAKLRAKKSMDRKVFVEKVGKVKARMKARMKQVRGLRNKWRNTLFTESRRSQRLIRGMRRKLRECNSNAKELASKNRARAAQTRKLTRKQARALHKDERAEKAAVQRARVLKKRIALMRKRLRADRQHEYNSKRRNRYLVEVARKWKTG